MRADSPVIPVPVIRVPVIRNAEITAGERVDAWFKVGGLAIAALLPAVFWTIVAASVGRYFGFDVSPSALAYTGSGIGLFLTAVCAPMIVNA